MTGDNHDNEEEIDLSDEDLEELHNRELEGGKGVPEYLGDVEPSGKLNKAKYWLMKGVTREELIEQGHNKGTVRIAMNDLVRDGHSKKPPRLLKAPPGEKPSTAVIAQGPARGIQVFAKGSPPEAIIEGISIPLVDGQAQGFEQGMKFGMSTIVLAVRVMQELSAVSLQQVKPLIDMTRSVREGEQAAFKSGADEGAMKAAQAMGGTILPMMSEMQANIANATKGNENDPMKAMMVRTMEPLMKNVMSKLIPGMKDQAPDGWSKRTE